MPQTTLGDRVQNFGPHCHAVLSQKNPKIFYKVRQKGCRWTCECPDHKYRKAPCKHILAVQAAAVEKEKAAGTGVPTNDAAAVRAAGPWQKTLDEWMNASDEPPVITILVPLPKVVTHCPLDHGAIKHGRRHPKSTGEYVQRYYCKGPRLRPDTGLSTCARPGTRSCGRSMTASRATPPSR